MHERRGKGIRGADGRPASEQYWAETLSSETVSGAHRRRKIVPNGEAQHENR